MHIVYPFSALVGQEDLKTALLLCTVEPSLGGVLIQGDKGTAKTTAVRGLAALIEKYRPVTRKETLTVSGDLAAAIPLRKSILTELPLNATEDRITGSIHLESMLKEGTRRFEPGLLAQAHGGILYVDEVNLLESHLVDILLDAAATGINRVEREGISVTHPARFILVGTMNPEEGDLRPQFLDRFGFTIFVGGLSGFEERREIIRRRLAFDADPEGFSHSWEASESLTAEMIRTAAATKESVEVPDECWDLTAELCSRAEVAGHRADITLIKGARALAALVEAKKVTPEHIKAMAHFVLPHRLPHSGIEGMKELTERAQQIIDSEGAGPGRVESGSFIPGDDGALDDPYDNTEIPGGAAAGSLVFDHFKKKTARDEFENQSNLTVVALPESLEAFHGHFAARGQEMEESPRGRGRQVRSRRATDLKGGIALGDTIIQAALARSFDKKGRLRISRETLRESVRVEPSGFTVLFVVDASDSMASVERLSAAKSAALYLLSQAYIRRLKVGMILFRGEKAYTVLEPTSSLSLVRRKLANLSIGEATPLAAGLVKSRELALSILNREGSGTVLTAVLTDGEANVPFGPGRITRQELIELAPGLVHPRIRYLFLDTSPGKSNELMQTLAALTGGRYLHLNPKQGGDLLSALEHP